MKKNIFSIFISFIIFLFSYAILHSVDEQLREALFYEKVDNKMVKCNLCPNFCRLPEGYTGGCKARKNINGKLYSTVYGKVAALHIDPIEKKPLYHFLPGIEIYSIATTGCNMRCKFCQNWEISQVYPEDVQTKYMSPEEIILDVKTKKLKAIAFTYTEPTVFYEYMLDIAKLAKKNGIKTVVVSAGYINPEPLKKLLPYIDAYKIDFKGFNPEFYKKLTGGKLEPVLETMKIIKKNKVWLEIVNLIIPGYNDSEEEIRNLALWIRENLGKEIPLHFTRFYPNYKLKDVPATPLETLRRARQIALDIGLKYVYTGNVPDLEGGTTYCNNKEPAIIRNGFLVIKNSLGKNGKCSDGTVIPGVWH